MDEALLFDSTNLDEITRSLIAKKYMHDILFAIQTALAKRQIAVNRDDNNLVEQAENIKWEVWQMRQQSKVRKLSVIEFVKMGLKLKAIMDYGQL